MNLTEFNRRFVWRKDGRLDTWRVLKGEGALYGDCDDYAMTALWITAGSSRRAWWWLVTFQAVPWWVWAETSGELHLALWVRGKGWIDNIKPEWKPTCGHRRIAPVLSPIVAFKLLLGKLL